MRRSRSVVALGFLALLSLAGCSSPSAKSLYREALADYGGHRGHGGLRPEVLERQNERFDTARRWAAEGALETDDDLVYAAALLATSDRKADLELAHELAWQAADRGDERGSQIAAEAIDKLCLHSGLPQIYGTQYVFSPVTATWRLYAVDPATTDEQRHRMGIPPLAELEARADELNRELDEKRQREKR